MNADTITTTNGTTYEIISSRQIGTVTNYMVKMKNGRVGLVVKHECGMAKRVAGVSL